VENLVAIELAYVNTRHPDFDEARLIYRGLTDDVVDSSDLRKVSVHNAMTHGTTASKQVVVVSLYSLRHPHYHYFCIRLMAFFQDNLGKPAPER